MKSTTEHSVASFGATRTTKTVGQLIGRTILCLLIGAWLAVCLTPKQSQPIDIGQSTGFINLKTLSLSTPQSKETTDEPKHLPGTTTTIVRQERPPMVPTTTTTQPKPVPAPKPVAPHPTVAPPSASSGLPPFLVCVRQRESRGNYTAVNPQSGAGGAYQFMPSTWAAMGFAARYGVSRAEWASPAQQDQAAIETLAKVGTSPWGGSCG